MEKVSFIHLRFTNVWCEIVPHGGTTIAYRQRDDGVEYAVAHCSKRDNFCKAYGRAKSQGRLNSDKHRKVFNGDLSQFKNQIVSLV